jgi:hypothetical protein
MRRQFLGRSRSGIEDKGMMRLRIKDDESERDEIEDKG